MTVGAAIGAITVGIIAAGHTGFYIQFAYSSPTAVSSFFAQLCHRFSQGKSKPG